MSNQLQITGGAKVRNLEGAIVGSSGVLSSVGLGVANGVATLGTDGKVPTSQLPALNSSYKGVWNAATNTPTIANGVGTSGDYYIVTTGGVWNGITFTAGQTVVYNGSIWQQAGGSAGVTSVGLSAPAAFTVSGSPVTSTGTLSINAAGTSAQYISGAGTLISFPTNLVTTSRTISTISPLSGGGALSADLTLTIQKATSSVDGYLSSADWNTFNNKQPALGFTPYNATNPSGFISGITYSNVVTALGYTPYNASNPSGFITSAGSISGSAGSVAWAGVTGRPTALSYFTNDLGNYGGWITGINYSMVVTALGFTPYNASNPNGFITSAALTGYLQLGGGTLTGNLTTNSGVTITASAFYELSDIRYKNILEVNPIIDLSALGVIKFTFKEDEKAQVRYGYSAQEVQAILPDVVSEKDKLFINYCDIHTLKIAQLESKIIELENKLNSLCQQLPS
jgi:hypothetical protein